MRKGSVGREILEWIITLALGVGLALLMRTFVFTLAIVEGDSMEDTLHTGQIMFVWKVEYRFSEPERGQIVFCQYPNLPEHCVKRVIGLPGDTVEIRDSTVYVNGGALDETYLTRWQCSDMATVNVPEGRYFVLGDNRPVSQDSRDPDVGCLEAKAIEGHALCILWPLSAISSIS